MIALLKIALLSPTLIIISLGLDKLELLSPVVQVKDVALELGLLERLHAIPSIVAVIYPFRPVPSKVILSPPLIEPHILEIVLTLGVLAD